MLRQAMSPPASAEPPATPAGERTIDRFLPRADARERHQVLVRAPAGVVFEVAERFDLMAIPVVHAIFWLRAKAMGGELPPARWEKGFVSEMTRIGWGVLARRPGRELVAGAVTRPWEANVAFRPVPPDAFAAFAEPGLVKIAWTIEAEPAGEALTRLRTETRALATDEGARRRFRRYWRLAQVGIVLIRWLALPAIRRQAERRYREGEASP
jgi:hypothetical protein